MAPTKRINEKEKKLAKKVVSLNKKIDNSKYFNLATIFFFLYSIIFLIVSINNGFSEYIYYNIGMLIIFLFIIKHKKKFHLETPFIFGLVILGFLHLAGGNIFVNGIRLYQNSLYALPYDKIIHFFGSFVLSLIIYNHFFELIKKQDRNKIFLISTIIFFVSFGIGAMVEVFEFFATILFEGTIVGDYANNAADLVANGLGIIAGIFFSIYHNKKN